MSAAIEYRPARVLLALRWVGLLFLSLVPAALVLLTVLSATLALDSAPRLPVAIAAWSILSSFLGDAGSSNLSSSPEYLMSETLPSLSSRFSLPRNSFMKFLLRRAT